MSTIKALENLIDYCSTKNNIISKNLANIGTEGYQRKEVVFKDIFATEINSNLKATDSRHINSPGAADASGGIQVITDTDPNMVSGVNNVDVEKEMADLAENTIHFKFAANKIGNYYKTLQKVIKGDPA